MRILRLFFVSVFLFSQSVDARLPELMRALFGAYIPKDPVPVGQRVAQHLESLQGDALLSALETCIREKQYRFVGAHVSRLENTHMLRVLNLCLGAKRIDIVQNHIHELTQQADLCDFLLKCMSKGGQGVTYIVKSNIHKLTQEDLFSQVLSCFARKRNIPFVKHHIAKLTEQEDISNVLIDCASFDYIKRKHVEQFVDVLESCMDNSHINAVQACLQNLAGYPLYRVLEIFSMKESENAHTIVNAHIDRTAGYQLFILLDNSVLRRNAASVDVHIQKFPEYQKLVLLKHCAFVGFEDIVKKHFSALIRHPKHGVDFLQYCVINRHYNMVTEYLRKLPQNHVPNLWWDAAFLQNSTMDQQLCQAPLEGLLNSGDIKTLESNLTELAHQFKIYSEAERICFFNTLQHFTLSYFKGDIFSQEAGAHFSQKTKVMRSAVDFLALAMKSMYDDEMERKIFKHLTSVKANLDSVNATLLEGHLFKNPAIAMGMDHVSQHCSKAYHLALLSTLRVQNNFKCESNEVYGDNMEWKGLFGVEDPDSPIQLLVTFYTDALNRHGDAGTMDTLLSSSHAYDVTMASKHVLMRALFSIWPKIADEVPSWL